MLLPSVNFKKKTLSAHFRLKFEGLTLIADNLQSTQL